MDRKQWRLEEFDWVIISLEQLKALLKEEPLYEILDQEEDVDTKHHITFPFVYPDTLILHLDKDTLVVQQIEMDCTPTYYKGTLRKETIETYFAEEEW